MSKELITLTAKDLTTEGINTQLTSNDLVEVIATEICDKMTKMVDDVITKGKELEKKYNDLYDTELLEMKELLIKNKYISSGEMVGIDYSETKGGYWDNRVPIKKFYYNEISAGDRVKINTDSFRVPHPSQKVLLKVYVTSYDKNDNTMFGEISCKINNQISKSFTKEIKQDGRFKAFKKEVEEYNEILDNVYESLPASKILSVEKFTRDARVKMNKKLISSQSPEFKDKLSKVFNIKLN